MLKLDLGAGPNSPAGFTPLGHVNGTTIFPLPYADGSVDEIRASHVLEHFSHREVPLVLADWVRALKPGGLLRIAVPNFELIAQRYLDGEPQITEGYIMGGQVDGADFHKALFDKSHLKEMLAHVGLIMLGEWKSELPDDCAALPISLNLSGSKPRRARPHVRGVMTTPRLGFNDMWNCAMMSLPKLGIDFRSVSGAFWEQCLTLAFEDVMEDGAADYVLAIDYDSVFTAGHVAKLVQLAMLYPDADAIAPLQSSRHTEKPLFGLPKNYEAVADGAGQVDVEREEFEVELTPVPQAHFGLTLIKTTALRKLIKPWFHAQPNKSGLWAQGKIDADISFWRKWERAGFSLYLAPRVVIGHLELMVRWPDENMQPIWQSAKDWEHSRRAPASVWTGEPE